jgi:DNA-binding CsgD family transcriptional regulator
MGIRIDDIAPSFAYHSLKLNLTLSPVDKTILNLEKENRTVEEIAEAIGLTTRAVETRLLRIHARARDLAAA